MSCFSEQVNMMTMKVKLIFRGAWNSFIAWPDWPREKQQEKTVLSVCSKDLDFVLIYFCAKNSFGVSSIWKIPILFQFLRLLYFQKSHMNIKLRFQLRSGPLISTVRQGLCGLNPALLGGFPEVSNPPIDLLFPAVKTITCHFPTVNLVSY